jgi:hypothetical protein
MAREARWADAVGAMRRTLVVLLVGLTCLGASAAGAGAAGARVDIVGGTPRQQATVQAALDASSFDWSVLPRTITVHIGNVGESYSTYGDVYLDASLLNAGRWAWGVVQHELGHQVDFFLFDDAKRATMLKLLGGTDWCYGVQGLKHSDYGCERFASELAWAYWQSPDNSMRPTQPGDEAGFMPAAEFRATLAQLLGRPSLAQAPSQAKAFAPATAKKPKRR